MSAAKDTMYVKGNKYFADWRDADGRRRRKSFPTKLGAERHEAKMVAARPLAGGSSQANSPQSSRKAVLAVMEERGGQQRGRSTKSADQQDSTNSASVTSALSKRSGLTSRRQVAASLTTRSGASLRRSPIAAHPTSAARFPSPRLPKRGKSNQSKPN
ncbi:MAG TPA: hypothetical protein VIM67_04270 [Terriglobus sp.]